LRRFERGLLAGGVKRSERRLELSFYGLVWPGGWTSSGQRPAMGESSLLSPDVVLSLSLGVWVEF
jgi:hypothetical protein